MTVETLTQQILSKMPRVGKVQSHFFTNLVRQWLFLRGRYCFDNLSRQGFLKAESYRKHFSRIFDFAGFNHLLISQHASDELFIAFDPCFVSKSGKHTFGLGRFWSGCAQSVKWGLEVASLAMVDVKNHTAFHYMAAQTKLEEGQTLMQFYVAFIEQYLTELKQLSSYIVVDAFFAKHEFIAAMQRNDLHVITRLRDDAALWYIYRHEGNVRPKRGRPKKYDGKVNLKELDDRHAKLVGQTKTHLVYESIVFSKAFKRAIKIVVVQNLKEDQSIKTAKVFASTDIQLDGNKLWNYYKLRFQEEFLFRDAKQFLGMTHCQSRQKQRLGYHINLSLTVISIVKIVHWISLPIQERGAFSIQNIKTHYSNQHLLDKFIIGLQLCPKLIKNTENYHKLINYQGKRMRII